MRIADKYQTTFIKVAFSVIAAILGSGTLLPGWVRMYGIWTRDPLRSIGACFPIVSLVGVLFIWRRLQWRMERQLWGIFLIVASGFLARFFMSRNPILAIGNARFSLSIWGSAFFLYGVGAVLLFGGSILLRASIAPLCLLLFVDPVPTWHNSLVDLPLQQLSAATSRGFAHLIGLQPSGAQLRMMFAPDFGIMIVPGCDGVRGSVTLAYIALIFGYSLKLRSRKLAFVTASAFLSGFILNLLRLCILMTYYRLGLVFPCIRRYGTIVDYVLGGALFLVATIALGVLIRFLRPSVEHKPYLNVSGSSVRSTPARAVALQIVLLLSVSCAFAATEARTLHQVLYTSVSNDEALRLLPQRVGAYQLVRTHQEQYLGKLAFVLGDYEDTSDPHHEPRRLSFGFWLAGPSHSISNSQRTHGLRPLSTGSFEVFLASGEKTRLYSTVFDERWKRELDAEANCTIASCNPELRKDTGIRFELRSGTWEELLGKDTKHLPILIRRDLPETGELNAIALQDDFEHDVAQFVHNINLKPIVQSAGSRAS